MGYSSRLTFSVMLGLGTVAGCQNWSNLSSGLPIQNPSRVPPPGTGTYPASTGYYNNSNSTLPTTQAKGPAPTTNAALSSSPVVRASWQADPAPKPSSVNSVAGLNAPPMTPLKPLNSSEFTDTRSLGTSAVPSQASLSDAPTETASQLNWQVPR